jgi:hypothetical protein
MTKALRFSEETLVLGRYLLNLSQYEMLKGLPGPYENYRITAHKNEDCFPPAPLDKENFTLSGLALLNLIEYRIIPPTNPEQLWVYKKVRLTEEGVSVTRALKLASFPEKIPVPPTPTFDIYSPKIYPTLVVVLRELTSGSSTVHRSFLRSDVFVMNNLLLLREHGLARFITGSDSDSGYIAAFRTKEGTDFLKSITDTPETRPENEENCARPEPKYEKTEDKLPDPEEGPVNNPPVSRSMEEVYNSFKCGEALTSNELDALYAESLRTAVKLKNLGVAFCIVYEHLFDVANRCSQYMDARDRSNQKG